MLLKESGLIIMKVFPDLEICESLSFILGVAAQSSSLEA